MNNTNSTNNCMRSTNIFTLTRNGETTYVAVPFRCRSLKCNLCGAEIIDRLRSRINFYAREDYLDFFITLTSSSTKKREALQELETLWKNIRKNMMFLDENYFVLYRIQQNSRKYNTSNAPLAYKKYIEKCKQADIQTQIARQARQHALITVAKAQRVNYSRLPSYKKVEFRAENEQRITNLYNLFLSEHDDTYKNWEENATNNINKIYEHTFDIQEKMKQKQEKITLKYVRTIEVGAGGHYHYHILSNQPISQHMINKYTVSGENNVYDCQLIQSETNNTVKYITKYLTKASEIDLTKSWITGSKGYKLLSEEDEDNTDENENEKWEYKQSLDIVTTTAQQFNTEEELDTYIEDHLFADTNDQSIILRKITEENYDWDEAQHISYIRARIIRLPKTDWNYTTILDEMHLHHDQKTAIRALEKYSCVLIDGAAGTGKTSIIPYVSSGYGINANNLAILAPTGKSAEVLRNKLSDSLQDRVMTIHSFLSYTRSRKFLRSDANIHANIKLIVVDETSMINASLFSKLLQSVPWDTKMVMFGDSNQLPSVENGTNFVQELQHVRGVHSIKLTYVHRNKDTVLSLAHKILAQDLTITSSEMIDIDMSKVVELINDGWQVLTNRKAVAQKINAEIQQNKQCNIVTYNGNFSLGDKIIISNNSKKNNIYNGQIGHITEYSNNKLTITLTNEQQVTWTQKEIISMDLFQLAYAITIHRSQGSEYDNVLIVSEKSKMEHEKDNLNTNALLYTAITRAKRNAMMMIDESLRERLILNKVNSFDFSSVVRFLTRREIEMLRQPYFSRCEIEHLQNTAPFLS